MASGRRRGCAGTTCSATSRRRLDAAEAASVDAEVADRARRESALLTLAGSGSAGRWEAGSASTSWAPAVDGRLLEVSDQWLLLAGDAAVAGAQVLVAMSAVQSVAGLTPTRTGRRRPGVSGCDWGWGSRCAPSRATGRRSWSASPVAAPSKGRWNRSARTSSSTEHPAGEVRRRAGLAHGPFGALALVSLLLTGQVGEAGARVVAARCRSLAATGSASSSGPPPSASSSSPWTAARSGEWSRSRASGRTSGRCRPRLAHLDPPLTPPPILIAGRSPLRTSAGPRRGDVEHLRHVRGWKRRRLARVARDGHDAPGTTGRWAGGSVDQYGGPGGRSAPCLDDGWRSGRRTARMSHRPVGTEHRPASASHDGERHGDRESPSPESVPTAPCAVARHPAAAGGAARPPGGRAGRRCSPTRTSGSRSGP